MHIVVNLDTKEMQHLFLVRTPNSSYFMLLANYFLFSLQTVEFLTSPESELMLCSIVIEGEVILMSANFLVMLDNHVVAFHEHYTLHVERDQTLPFG